MKEKDKIETLDDLYRSNGFQKEGGDITQAVYESISAEIDSCEEWHEKNGSIDHQLG